MAWKRGTRMACRVKRALLVRGPTLAKVRCPSRLGGRGASLDPPTSHNGFIPLPNPPSAATWAYILLFFANDRMSTLRLIRSRFCRVGKDCRKLTPNFAHDDKNCYTKVTVIINNFPYPLIPVQVCTGSPIPILVTPF